MFKTYLEIISQEKYKEFEKENKQYLTSEKYKKRLEELLKRFFTNENGKIVNTIIIPYISPNEYSFTLTDKKIISYLNNHDYTCTEESYLLGYCFNDKNKEMAIIDVLKMISQYNIEKLEKQKQENLQYGTQYDKRIKAKQDFKENYLTYYQNFNKKRSKVIVFTWLPRAIASMSTSVGWRSCMNLYDGENRNYVFPTIEAGTFIVWLVQKGDEEILDNPQARILIKAYVSKKDKFFWYPSGDIYGTASQDFYNKVKNFIIKKQEIHVTEDDLENIYELDKKQYVDNNDMETISLQSIFKDKYIKILENKNEFTIDHLRYAIENDLNINLIKKIFLFIKNTLKEESCKEILYLAYKNNNINAINIMLSHLFNDNMVDNSIIFKYAVKTNNIKLVKKILNKNIITNIPIDQIYSLLKEAIELGYTSIIKLLLQIPNIDLSIDNNKIIQLAAKYGHENIVKLLLQNPQIDPSDRNDSAIQYAAANGHTEIVKLLLQDKRVNPSNWYNGAIREAARNGRTEVVKLLLQDPRVNPSDYNDYAIQYAAKNGHTEVVKLLLQDKRVDPSANDNEAIRSAIYNGHIEVIKLLLQDPRIDLNKLNKNDYIIQSAIKRGYIEVIKLLLQDPRVRSLIDIDYMIQLAQKNGNTEIIQLLQQYK